MPTDHQEPLQDDAEARHCAEHGHDWFTQREEDGPYCIGCGQDKSEWEASRG